MKETITMHEARSRFCRLLDMISRAGKPIARVVPVGTPPIRQLGRDMGVFTVADDFDYPVPEEVLAQFER